MNDRGFQVREGAEGGAKIFGVFRVKNHDFTPTNHIFPILGGAREIFGVFHVKNHDFTPTNHIFPILGGAREIFGVFHVKNHDFTPKKNHIFSNFRGGAPPPPPESPLQYSMSYVVKLFLIRITVFLSV